MKRNIFIEDCRIDYTFTSCCCSCLSCCRCCCFCLLLLLLAFFEWQCAEPYKQKSTKKANEIIKHCKSWNAARRTRARVVRISYNNSEYKNKNYFEINAWLVDVWLCMCRCMNVCVCRMFEPGAQTNHSRLPSGAMYV